MHNSNKLVYRSKHYKTKSIRGHLYNFSNKDVEYLSPPTIDGLSLASKIKSNKTINFTCNTT